MHFVSPHNFTKRSLESFDVLFVIFNVGVGIFEQILHMMPLV